MLKATSLLGNSQRLDGGAMFGNAPRALWSKFAPPDELGRVALACRALLVESPAGKVLCETGIGAFFEPSLRERYGVVETEHVLLKSLAARGVQEADIDVVVLSHLHFDHAGGLLKPFREGVAPELCFPRAEFVVTRGAWERARRPHPRDRASFIPELPDLLERSGRLRVLDSLEEGERLLGEHFSLRTSDGHTPSMLHAWVRGERAELFFCADLAPGTAWPHLPITMGYDRYPERLVDEKSELFAELLERNTHLFFTHDPQVAAARLTRDAKGRYAAGDRYADFADWDLDANLQPCTAS